MELSQELLILREAKRFRGLAELAWSKDTVYPSIEYIAGASNGQCGVTNFGFGLWLSQLGIVRCSRMAFEEGKIVNALGCPIGDNHTWLRVSDIDDGYTHPDLTMRFDLAGDQFPGIDVPEVVQYDDYFYPDPHTPSSNRVYQTDRITSFRDYDSSKFAGRLSSFMHAVCDIAGCK